MCPLIIGALAPSEKASLSKEVIDMDVLIGNTMVVFSAIKELRNDTEESWKKLAVPLDQVVRNMDFSHSFLA